MSELYDPEFNVSYGTRMLSGLVAKRGSVRDGLMAYGPANVGYYYADKVLAIYENNRNSNLRPPPNATLGAGWN